MGACFLEESFSLGDSLEDVVKGIYVTWGGVL
jgi:hypothetical protein